jgi:Family of unknown function (DUF5906)/Primase C terminal 2 (PriCT-2)
MEQSQGARPAKPSVLTFIPAGVPALLKAQVRWVAWKCTQLANGKWTKTPVNARTGGGAMSNNPSTWASYEEAQAALLRNAELAGIGFMLGDGWIGVDADDCFSYMDGFSELAQDVLTSVAGYAEISPSSNGVKIITRGTIPQSHTDHKKGLEIYDRVRFFAVTGHAVNDRDNAIPTTPVDLTAFCAKHFGAHAATGGLEGDEFDALAHAEGPAHGWPLSRVVDELLPHLDPHGYKDWLDVGMALHHQGEADDEWCEAWDAWSVGPSDNPAEKYHPDACEEKWQTFGTHLHGQGEMRLATLIYRVKQQRTVAKYDREAHWSTQIAATNDKMQLQDEIPKLIAQDLLVDAKVREDLAQLLKRRIKALFNTSQPIGAIRGWLKPDVQANAQYTQAWLKPYVYVSDQDRFYDAERKIAFTRDSFNARHNRDMPTNDQGEPVKPAAVGATDMYRITVVDSALYQPALGRFFSFDGRACVNTYDDSQVPAMPPVLIDEEERAVALVQRHLCQLLADPRERQLFINWLAYVAQNPAKKIRWAPYLCGVPGDGKSFFGNLLGLVMGARNYRALSGEALKKDFTGWAVGQCVTLVEEIKLHGADKFDAVNRLKPFITNDVVDVRPMYGPSYNAPNTTQYLITSNYLDGVPITDDDRRFMFLQTAYSIDSLAAFKAANPDFYAELFAAIETYPGAMRYWLMHECDWHADFKPDANAPITSMRGLVIEMSESDADSACRSVWEEKPGGVTASWVAAASFASAVEAHMGRDAGLKRSQIGRICVDFLRAHGYRYMGAERHRVGPTGVQSRFWCHESMCQLKNQDWHNWWEIAKSVMEKSFSEAVAKDFLD